jgi:RHS repeat-associated protein
MTFGSGDSDALAYDSGTGRMTIPGVTGPYYDSNGNVIKDGFHSYTWDAAGLPHSIDGLLYTYDALGRAVEVDSGGSQLVYTPLGQRLGFMSGQTYQKGRVPLVAGAWARYLASGLAVYRHPDWLGSVRLSSTPSQTVYYDGARAPYGEPYAEWGTADHIFTGAYQDTVGDLYDFPFRENHPTQGRWLSPDPAGLAAADPTNPQSLNRYAYVTNNPLAFTDPLGLYAVDFDCLGEDIAGFPMDICGGWALPIVPWGGWGGGGGGAGGGGGSTNAGNEWVGTLPCLGPQATIDLATALLSIVNGRFGTKIQNTNNNVYYDNPTEGLTVVVMTPPQGIVPPNGIGDFGQTSCTFHPNDCLEYPFDIRIGNQGAVPGMGANDTAHILFSKGTNALGQQVITRMMVHGDLGNTSSAGSFAKHLFAGFLFSKLSSFLQGGCVNHFD